MKRACFVLFLALISVTLFGCSGSTEPTGSKTLEESPEMTEAIAKQIEEVNMVDNPREIDDFSVENEMGVDLEDLQAYAGDVTNTQSDCALVFVALCKDGKADTVKNSLEEYRKSMTSTLYLEFAAKVEQAEKARIVSSGNYVVMVIAGVNGPDYSAVDEAIRGALDA